MIPLFKPYLPPHKELFKELEKVLASGYIAEGTVVQEFEWGLSDYLDCRPIVATSSCTAALHLALILSGVGPGDEVISTPMTAEPTNLAILHTGATVVWADVNQMNGNIDWCDVMNKITNKTKAIMCVDYGGIPCLDYDMFNVPTDITIIEDAAHAFGAKWDNIPIGNHCDFTCFSFQAIKHLTTGDGGALALTKDEARARRLRWFGIDREVDREKVNITELGYKYNMNNLTAAMGLVQLRHIQTVVNKHIDNGKYFDEQLDPRANPWANVYPAEFDAECEPSYWFYTILVDHPDNRDDLSRKLTKAGIANGHVHRRNDWHKIFADSKCDLPGLDSFWERSIHIPCGWWVTEEDRERIVEVING